MDINEIARLAGVSASTVSKVVNHKDASISESTRERVLEVVRQYHYVPYAKSRALKSWLIGVVFRSPIALDSTIDGILSFAQERGYSTLVFSSNESAEQEERNLAAIASAGVSGLIWEPVNIESLLRRRDFIPKKVRTVTIGSYGGEDSLLLPYESASYGITQQLLDRGHTKVACLVDEGRRTRSFINGFRSKLLDSGIPCPDDLVYTTINAQLINLITSGEITGVVCSHYHVAVELWRQLSSVHLRCPRDVSIASLRNDTSLLAVDKEGAISTCTIRNSDFGRLACQRLISLLENHPDEKIFYQVPELDNHDSIGAPPSSISKCVTVVGSINLDTRLSVPSLPTSKITVSTEQSLVCPGGKGLNQAVGVARLGHRASLVGNVGDDTASNQIYELLKREGVNSTSVFRRGSCQTGHAFIMVEPTGESQITILSGANSTLRAEDIENRKDAFVNSQLCLIQSEIPADAVRAACNIAHRHGAKTILKPSSANSLDDELLANIDYLVPNQDELRAIAPGTSSIEEQAREMLCRGVSVVIVTLGADGCFVCTRSFERRFPAVNFPTIDATGAGDAFISAFAASLLDGYDLQSAVERASYAAGYSTARSGVVDSLIDKQTLIAAFPAPGSRA